MNKRTIISFMLILFIPITFCFAQKNKILINSFENLTLDTKNDFLIKSIVSSCVVSLLATGNFSVVTSDDAKKIKNQDNILQGSILSAWVDSEKKQAQIEVYYKLLDAKTQNVIFANKIRGESSIKLGYKGEDIPLFQEAVDNLSCKLSLDIAKFLFPKSIVSENIKQNEFKVNIGSKDGIKVGTEFEILRGQKIIGIAKALSVDKNVSTIAVISKEKDITVLPTDNVRPIVKTLKDTSSPAKSKSRKIRNVIIGGLIAGSVLYFTKNKDDKDVDIPPSISSLSFNPARPKIGDNVIVVCNVHNPNNYELKFNWTATGGSIEGEGQTVIWKMPNVLGEYYITVTVSDIKGRKVMKTSDAIQVSLISNNPPTLSLDITPPTINVGGVAIVVATASDQDGDVLTYTWTKTGGTITGTGPQVTYTAPSQAGRYSITCNVSDGKGGSVSKTADINVSLTTNNSPQVSLTATPQTIKALASSLIVATASDQDGDVLTYTWTKTGGTITGTGPQVTYTAPKARGNYQISVLVSDGKGGTAIAQITIMVENASPVVSIFASPVSVLPGESSLIVATASDQDGDVLTYTWTTTGGNIKGEGRQVIWTAPDDGDLNISSYAINVTVSDGKDGSADATISILVRRTNIANLLGYILDGRTSLPVKDVQVILISGNASKQAITNAQGYFIISNIEVGNANYTINKIGYVPIDNSISLNVGDNLITELLSPIETGTISGIITNSITGEPIGGAVVKAGTEYQNAVLYTITTTTNAQGQYILPNAPFAVFPPNQPPQLLSYTITADNNCYFEKTAYATTPTPTVGPSGTLTVNIPIEPFMIKVDSPTSGNFETIPANILTNVNVTFSWKTQNIHPIKISIIRADSGIVASQYILSNNIGAQGKKTITLGLNLPGGWYDIKADILQSGGGAILCNYTTTERDAIKVE